ncbi:GNAT family N-acetyltransferase [Pedobacter alpinus]|uniref:GNAT family N-acetyltransferase n=1 Tax=Pedobacter alpinus TaxID=1590643 RepID=A0ABW5TSS6_9SPHI
MNHILDNPIYQALANNHINFSDGNEKVRFYNRDIASFAGMVNYDLESFETLYNLSKDDDLFILFNPQQLIIPKKWNLIKQIALFQFVYEHNFVPEGNEDFTYHDLDDSNIEEMIALVKLTEPGPFFERTIDLSNYTGVFENGKLVAMAGHRFNPDHYIEISAVCTHPDYLGRGYAYALIREQIKRILAKAQTPFLHVVVNNVGAIKLYQKLGFKIRKTMVAYVINKEVQV